MGMRTTMIIVITSVKVMTKMIIMMRDYLIMIMRIIIMTMTMKNEDSEEKRNKINTRCKVYRYIWFPQLPFEYR